MLIPVDGSPIAENVLPYARLFARTLKLSVELLHVINISETFRSAGQTTAHIDDRVGAVEQTIAHYLRMIAASFSGLTVTSTVEKGRAEDIIIARAANDPMTLIAMATHGRSGLRRWLLGSTAEKVLRGASNPLLVIRAHEDAGTDGEAQLNSIIVPLDGSELAESALPVAVSIARALDLEVVLFRAYELPASAYYGKETYLPDYERLTSEVRLAAQGYLEEKAKTIRADNFDKVSLELLEGAGPHEIIESARHRPRSLVVMCTHGRSGVQRWVLGSVTEKVVRHSSAPVLVVRARR